MGDFQCHVLYREKPATRKQTEPCRIFRRLKCSFFRIGTLCFVGSVDWSREVPPNCGPLFATTIKKKGSPRAGRAFFDYQISEAELLVSVSILLFHLFLLGSFTTLLLLDLSLCLEAR